MDITTRTARCGAVVCIGGALQAATHRYASVFRDVLPSDQISVEPRTLMRNSQDYAWFSNILEEDLGGCRADIVLWPLSNDQIASVLHLAHAARMPVTVRGGGTGNYGQCVPLRGGIVLNLSRMNRILDMRGGVATVEAGVRFVDLDLAARALGQEVRIYPSTYLTATVAGFVCGGSGGIGSVTHGVIADGNVLGATIIPVCKQPSPSQATQSAMPQFIHAYGTTGVLADVTIPLAPRRTWAQLVCSFHDMRLCHDFCMTILHDQRIEKRLICTVEASITRYFSRAKLPFSTGGVTAILMVDAACVEAVTSQVSLHRGNLDVVVPAGSKTRLSDFTWNHTTLWAKKFSNELTYLQLGFNVEQFGEQVEAVKSRFGSDIALHCEYFRVAGEPFIAALPILTYKSRRYVETTIDFFEQLGIGVANPHTFVLEEGSRVENVDELLAAKRAFDPDGLLNPGKFRASLKPGESTAHAFKPASMSLARQRKI